MTNQIDWMALLNECRKQELPCFPVANGEPWFSAEFVASCFLCIERSDRFIAEWKRLGLPMLKIRNHPLIRMSDVERFGQAAAGDG